MDRFVSRSGEVPIESWFTPVLFRDDFADSLLPFCRLDSQI
jgi:hypothetical protein